MEALDRSEGSKRMVHLVDFDGTIVDVKDRYCAVHRDMCMAIGLEPVSDDQYWDARRKGMPERGILRDLYRMRDRASVEAYMDRRRLLLESPQYLKFDRPIPGWAEALDILRRTGRCVLLSQRRVPNCLMEELRWLGMSDVFHSIEVTQDKKSCIPRYLVDGGCGIITDFAGDVELVRGAGAGLVAVSSGLSSPEALLASGALVVKPTILEAAKHIGGFGYGLLR